MRRRLVSIAIGAALFIAGVFVGRWEPLSSEGVSALLEAMKGVGALLIAYATLKGVDTWREQLKGKDEYELAKRILLSCYRVERVIREIRYPFSPDLEKHFSNLNEFAAEMDFNLLEGKLFWGNSLYERRHALCRAITQVTHAHRECKRLNSCDVRDEERKRINEKYFDIAYGQGGAHSDDFAKQVSAAVRQIEEALEQHIR